MAKKRAIELLETRLKRAFSELPDPVLSEGIDRAFADRLALLATGRVEATCSTTRAENLMRRLAAAWTDVEIARDVDFDAVAVRLGQAVHLRTASEVLVEGIVRSSQDTRPRIPSAAQLMARIHQAEHGAVDEDGSVYWASIFRFSTAVACCCFALLVASLYQLDHRDYSLVPLFTEEGN